MRWLGYIILFLQWTFCASQKEIPRSCGPPPVIDNSIQGQYIRQVFPSGSDAFYQCYRLFEMEGTPRAMCLNGQWRGVPRCVETCKAEETEMDQNNIYLKHITKSTSHIASDYWMYFDCKPGYRKDPLSSPFTKQCVRGPWVYPRCIL